MLHLFFPQGQSEFKPIFADTILHKLLDNVRLNSQKGCHLAALDITAIHLVEDALNFVVGEQ